MVPRSSQWTLSWSWLYWGQRSTQDLWRETSGVGCLVLPLMSCVSWGKFTSLSCFFSSVGMPLLLCLSPHHQRNGSARLPGSRTPAEVHRVCFSDHSTRMAEEKMRKRWLDNYPGNDKHIINWWHAWASIHWYIYLHWLISIHKLALTFRAHPPQVHEMWIYINWKSRRMGFFASFSWSETKVLARIKKS